MKKMIAGSLLFMVFIVGNAQELPHVRYGEIKHVGLFESDFVEPRNIEIWLPEGYDGTTKFDVLYMHDGQMLYDATKTWNKQAWDIDDIAGRLLMLDSIRPFIVVGIWNSGANRHPDYFPQKPFESLSAAEKDTVNAQLRRSSRTEGTFKPQSDNYLKFLVHELKPFIDKNYSVNTSPENTFIAGSSMGGLISMYALCEYPGVFGGAACLSTHWPGTFTLENNPVPDAFVNYLANNLPSPKKHKVYFDYGNQTLDALYPPLQKKVDSVMQQKGYSDDLWQTWFFNGMDHSEASWKKRLHVPLLFLFKK